MVETYAPGRELTCTVMGDRALCVTEIITTGWYDYAAKYTAGGSRHVCPADLPAEIAETIRDYALRAHRALGCRGVSRTDFRWDESRGTAGLILLETNTQPGMTPTSLAPEQAAVIVQNIYVDLLESKAWGFRFSIRLRADVLQSLSSRTPREVKNALVTGCARALQAGRNHLRLEDLDPPPPAPRRIGFN